MSQRQPRLQLQHQQSENQIKAVPYVQSYDAVDSSHLSIAHSPFSNNPSTANWAYQTPPLSSSSSEPNIAGIQRITLATRPNPYRVIEQQPYPWNLPSAASSSATLNPLSSQVYQGSVSDRHKLINSSYSNRSRLQSSTIDSHDIEHFKAVELHNTKSRPFTPSTMRHREQDSANDLASINSSARPSLSQQMTKKKRNFWPSFPRKFRFRPDGVERHRKADSVGNKKAKFSNERTMIHWIKAAMLMGSLAMTLLSFGKNNITPYIGLALLMTCLMTLIYTTTTFHVRMEWLNMRRDDVNYYDRFAPTILTIILMMTFAFNAIVVYTGDFKTNKDFLKHK